ncbi:MAG: ATP-binding protein [Lachnospiraceae bacterium]|nr:ATP-binding protein [Lachnospiraceae bacterium]
MRKTADYIIEMRYNLLEMIKKMCFQQIIRMASEMGLVGRERENAILANCLRSKRPEFLIVYGRRRVGKTYLIRDFFREKFSFYTTGIPDEKTRNQLKAFNESLMLYGDKTKIIPKDWFEAFRRLRQLLERDNVCREYSSGKRVVFLDEVPWMDTARSDFKSAFDFFWNSWGSAQEDLLLIVCGSATSWIINNIIDDKGGFHNRITKRMHLEPFTLGECEQFFLSNGIRLNRDKIIENYMIFGGIPYYLNLYDRKLSSAQNVDSLILDQNGDLYNEYEHLFRSLYKNATNHMKVIETIAQKRRGVQRTELAAESGISDGEGLTKVLRELEQCGFIRKYENLTSRKNGCFYQVTDPYVLFSLTFLNEKKKKSWQNFMRSPEFYAWRGNAFEIVCLNHISQIKAALGISGVESSEYSWKSKKKSGGAQIDLLIDRRDDVINLCEMKYTDTEFVIDKKYRDELLKKTEVFVEEVHPDKSIHLTFISANGLKENENADVIQNVIGPEKLFAL